MKAMKKIAAAGLAVAMVASLAACDSMGNSFKDDGKTYLQGQMDEIYLGQINEDYLKVIDMTEEEALQERQDMLEAEAENFAYTFSIEDLNDEVKAEIVELVAEVYSHAKYEIVSATELESGNLAMEVKLEPIDVMTRVTDDDVASAWEETLTHFDVTQEDVAAMSDEDFFALDNYYAELIIQKVRDQMPNLDYLSAITATIAVQEFEDNTYDINWDDFGNMDAKMMPYN